VTCRPRALTGGSWRPAGLSAAATRLVAAAGAVVIVAAGGYLAAQQAGISAARPPSPPRAAAAPELQLTPGPGISYGPPGSLDTIPAAESRMNFTAARLRAQAISAVRAVEHLTAFTPQPPARTAAVLTARTAHSATLGSPSASRLAGCIDLIAPGQTVLLIDIARYQGKPAAVVVTAAIGAGQAQAWVVGSSCSAETSDVLAHAALGNL